MASPERCIARLSRSSLLLSLHSRFGQAATRLPLEQVRTAVVSQNALKYRRSDKVDSAKKKKQKARPTFIQYDLKNAEQFALLDAMRYEQTLRVLLAILTSL